MGVRTVGLASGVRPTSRDDGLRVTLRRGGRVVWLLGLLGLLGPWGVGPSGAVDLRWVDEVKLGVLSHDNALWGLGHHVEPGADLNVEVLGPSPAFLQGLWAPRPHLGFSVNTAGATDYGYLGLTWRGRPWRPLLPLLEGLFVAGSLGGAIHDGYLNTAPPEHKLLGTRLLFRYSLEGGYQLTRGVNVSFMLDHLSNGHVVRHNQGLNELGVRIGLSRFPRISW